MTSAHDLANELALAHDGLFSIRQAHGVGLSTPAVRRLIQARMLVSVIRGWYAPSEPLRSERDAHLLMARAVKLTYGERARPSHHTALLLHGLPIHCCDLLVAHVTRTAGGSFRRHRTHIVHAADRSVAGPPTSAPVSAGFAVVQTGLLHGPRAAIVAGDAALAMNVATREDLAAAVESYRRVHGIGPVSAVVDALDPRSESPGESLLRYDLWLCGFSVVSQFVVVVGSARYRADFRVRGTRVLLEFDGMTKYAGDPAALRREKVREERLRAAGWTVVRFVWSDLGHVSEIRERIRRALATSAWAS